MIRFFRFIFEWLDRRFPPKVKITREIYEDLLSHDIEINRRVASLSDNLLYLQGELDKTIKSLNAIKDILAKNGNIIIKTEADKLRDQFIKEGHIRNAA